MRNQFGADDYVGRIVQMDTEEMTPERLAQAARHLIDGEAGGVGRDDRIGRAKFIDLREKFALERQLLGERFEDQPRFRHRARQIGIVGAERDTLLDGFGARRVLGGLQRLARLVEVAREHGDVVARTGEDGGGGRTHRTAGAQYDYFVGIHPGCLRIWFARARFLRPPCQSTRQMDGKRPPDAMVG